MMTTVRALLEVGVPPYEVLRVLCWKHVRRGAGRDAAIVYVEARCRARG